MIIESAVAVFLQYGMPIVLDRLIAWITQEEMAMHEIEANIPKMHGTIDDIQRRQSEIVQKIQEVLKIQLHLGLLELQQARNCDPESRAFHNHLNRAVSAFNHCEATDHFTGLKKVDIFFSRAVCHNLLHERRNAIADLEKARSVAQEVANAGGETFILQPVAEPFVIHLKDGATIPATRWVKQQVPNKKDGALARIREIESALYALKNSH